MVMNIRLILMTILLFVVPLSTSAFYLPDSYTNSNFSQSYHDVPESFSRDSSGNFSGVTSAGKVFTQQYVTASISVRLQRFAIDDAYFYVSSKGIINAESDIQALSMYLSFYDLSLEDFS